MTVTDDQKFLVEYAYYKDPNGELYPLFGGNRCLLSWEGAGIPDIDYLSDRGPNQHGRTVRDFRANDRRITLEIYERGKLRNDWYTNMYNLIDAIRPNRSSTNAPGYLLFIRPDLTEREIEARIESGARGDWLGLSANNPTDINDSMTFYCGDPFFRDPAQNSQNFTLNPTSSCLPTCLPTCIGGSGLINSSVNVSYTGTWEGDQIEIIITGPATSPIIRNDTSGKEIKLNYTVSEGEAITINISPTRATVENNSGINLIGAVDSIADLNDFRIVTAGDLTSTGVNTITVLASGGETPQTAVIFKYYTRDLSLFGA